MATQTQETKDMMMNRRQSSTALAVGSLMSVLSAHGQTQTADRMVMKNKIDTHQHFLPKVYVDGVGLETLASVMPTKRAPDWSEEAAIAMMDQHGIAQGILSISSGPRIPNAVSLLRKCNEEAAAIQTRHPGRFGQFASLPLPDIDGSLREIAHSLDVLKANGVILFSNYDGKYLGDPMYAPVMDELNRRKAVAFIHPNEPPYHLAGLPPASVLEFPFDTTRAATSLIMSGAMRRWPDIRFILSHAGGALPYLAYRMGGAVMMNPSLRESVGDPLMAVRQFWFDTALSLNEPAMKALLSVADPGKIVFGTDFPMAPAFMIKSSADGAAQSPWLEGLRDNIARNNALNLLRLPAAAGR
jgi:6-methylsalicylate decarboxylase